MIRSPKDSPADLLAPVVAIARAAGRAVLEVYETDFEVRNKADASPVTDADLRAQAIIVPSLLELTPGVPVVSEEDADAVAGTGALRFWLVDPLDGTKEFIQRNGEFTVNIGLVEDRRPVLGVVFAPAIDRLFAGAAQHGSFAESDGCTAPIACRPVPDEGLTAVSSRSHGDDEALRSFLRGRRVARSIAAGSSLKFCLVAAGEADLYPRLGRTMEWDTAAGHAVLSAAGGRVTDVGGAELRYGKPEFANPPFVASGSI